MKKGENDMVKFYVNRVKAGKMELENVPERWKAAVEAELAKEN